MGSQTLMARVPATFQSSINYTISAWDALPSAAYLTLSWCELGEERRCTHCPRNESILILQNASASIHPWYQVESRIQPFAVVVVVQRKTPTFLSAPCLLDLLQLP